MLNFFKLVGVDGTGRYPCEEWAFSNCANLGGTAEARKALVPCICKGWGPFFIYIEEES